MITNQFKSPLDRAAGILMLVLLVLTILLLIVGDRTAPYVREFSWRDREIGSEDTAFTVNFSRSMNREQVESQLHITRLPTPTNPSERLPIAKILPGKISWAGKKMLYTLDRPVPYGNQYQLEVQGAKAVRNHGQVMSPFAGKFTVRERQFAFIGTEGEGKGRLVLNQFGKSPEVILTPANLLVTDFRFAPKGSAVVYSATSATDTSSLLASQQIYRVPIDRQQPVAQSELILDSKEYQNVKFDLAPDGKTIVVQRVKRQDAKDAGIWSLSLEPGAQLQKISQGGDFMITPDSAAIAVAEGEGVAITPLTPEVKPWDFLPRFGMVLSFAKDGRAAAMVKFNNDYTRALFLVNNQGEQKELLKINGDFKMAQFSPNGKEIYCITEIQESSTNQDGGMPQPYLIAIDIATAKAIPLLKLPPQQGIFMSLSPDGRALMFDQVVTGPQAPGEQKLSTPDGQAIQQGMIWLTPLPSSIANFKDKIQPEQLPIAGFYPQWVP
jgi:Tol biopolymer transport system component